MDAFRYFVSNAGGRLKPAMHLVGAVMMTFSASGVVAPPASASQVQGHALRGTNEFVVNGTTGSAFVRFPRPVDAASMSATYDGSGVLGGIVLVEPNADDTPAVLAGLAMGRCPPESCARRTEQLSLMAFNVRGKVSGVWEVHVIGGSPGFARVNLRVPGLGGAQRIHARKRSNSQLETLAAEPRVGIERQVFSAGAFTRLADPSFGFVGLWAAFPAGVHRHAAGTCVTGPGAVDDATFLPGCPYGDGEVYPYEGDSFELASFRLGRPAGLGAWYSSSAAATDSGAVALWMSF